MRTFTNPGTDAVEIPSLGVSIGPGETVDVDLAAKVPCPSCLTEVVEKDSPKKSAAKADAPTEAK